MSVTNIGPGRYRHVESGLIVHEVRSLGDVLVCGGLLLCVAADNTKWIWLAGRDLKDAIAVSGATTISDLAVYLRENNQFTAWTMGAPEQAYSITAPYAHKDGTFTMWDRAFGIVTNVDCGYGHSFIPNPNPSNPVIGHNDTRGVGNVNSHYNASIGTVAVNIDTGKTWAQFAAEFYGAMPHRDKVEVRSRIEAATARLGTLWDLCYKTPLSSRAVIRAPLVLLRGSLPRWIPPVTNRVHNYNIFGGMWNAKSQWVRHIGTRSRCDSGAGLTTPVGLVSGGVYGWNEAGDQASTGGGASVVVSAPLVDAFFGTIPLIRSLDGVRIERLLGGLSADQLTDTSEKTQVTGTDLTSVGIVQAALSAVRIDNNTLPTRPLDGTNNPVSDAAWSSAGNGIYAAKAGYDLSDILYSNYDTFGPGFGGLCGLAAAALDPDKLRYSDIYHLRSFEPMVKTTARAFSTHEKRLVF